MNYGRQRSRRTIFEVNVQTGIPPNEKVRAHVKRSPEALCLITTPIRRTPSLVHPARRLDAYDHIVDPGAGLRILLLDQRRRVLWLALERRVPQVNSCRCRVLRQVPILALYVTLFQSLRDILTSTHRYSASCVQPTLSA